MARWQAGTQQRLQAAALELFAGCGFDGVTVAEIATAAGLTERTFFRYFTDKREVLFSGQEEFRRLFLDGIAAAPQGPPMALVTAALEHATSFFPDDRRAGSRSRQRVIDTHVAFQERELWKLSTLATAMTAALAGRGVDDATARLAAETGLSVFRIAFARWIEDGEQRGFAEIQAVVLAELQALVGSA